MSLLRANDLLIVTFSGKPKIPCLSRMNITDKELCFYCNHVLLFFFLDVYWFLDSLVPFLRPPILHVDTGSRLEVAMTKAVTMETC